MMTLPAPELLRKLIFAIPCLALAAGCASPDLKTPDIPQSDIEAEREFQRRFVLDNHHEERTRLQDIAFQLRSANSAVCAPRTTYHSGLMLAGDARRPDRQRWLQERFSHRRQAVTVIHAIAGSPAFRAGFRPGDSIISVTIGDHDAVDQPADIINALDLEKLQDTRHYVEIERAGKRHTLSFRPQGICAGEVYYDENPDVNAYTDGKKIVFSRGLIDFAANDDEIGFVIGHELAHIHLGHIDKKQANAIVGGIGGLMVDLLFKGGGFDSGYGFARTGMASGIEAYSVEFEAEADYLGIYLTDRAGFDARVAANFWRRMAVVNPRATTQALTHPTTPERFLAINATLEEIERKKKAGQKPEPNLKR